MPPAISIPAWLIDTSGHKAWGLSGIKDINLLGSQEPVS